MCNGYAGGIWKYIIRLVAYTKSVDRQGFYHCLFNIINGRECIVENNQNQNKQNNQNQNKQNSQNQNKQNNQNQNKKDDNRLF